MLSQFYQRPYFTTIAPAAYSDYGLQPMQEVGYNEWDQYSHFLLQPIDSSFMPDTPIPGFQGLGETVPAGAIAIGLTLLILMFRKKK